MDITLLIVNLNEYGFHSLNNKYYICCHIGNIINHRSILMNIILCIKHIIYLLVPMSKARMTSRTIRWS